MWPRSDRPRASRQMFSRPVSSSVSFFPGNAKRLSGTSIVAKRQAPPRADTKIRLSSDGLASPPESSHTACAVVDGIGGRSSARTLVRPLWSGRPLWRLMVEAAVRSPGSDRAARCKRPSRGQEMMMHLYALVMALATVLPATAQQPSLGGWTHPTAPSPWHVAAGDVDGDGLSDLVTSNTSPVSSLYLATQLAGGASALPRRSSICGRPLCSLLDFSRWSTSTMTATSTSWPLRPVCYVVTGQEASVRSR